MCECWEVKFLVIAILIANFVAKQIAKLSAKQITELSAKLFAIPTKQMEVFAIPTKQNGENETNETNGAKDVQKHLN